MSKETRCAWCKRDGCTARNDAESSDMRECIRVTDAAYAALTIAERAEWRKALLESQDRQEPA